MNRCGCDQTRAGIIACATLSVVLHATSLPAADPSSIGHTSPDGMLLTDSMGRSVEVSTNAIPAALRPSLAAGSGQQIPQPAGGARQPEAVRQRLEAGRAQAGGLTVFPAAPPRLMPYLANMDEFGNTALRPGALVDVGPLEAEAQGAKYWLSDRGLRYSLEQTLSGVGLSDAEQGSSLLGYYTLYLQAKWAVFEAPGWGAGWLSTDVDLKFGLGRAGAQQSAGSNIGSLTEPSGIWSPVNGVRMSELAWQQSLVDGELVIVAGMVDQSDYLDLNAYANDGRGQFLNSALINSQVLPLPGYNFGANLQWQPQDDWYTLLGVSGGNAAAGQAPWSEFSLNTWSLTGELGYAPADVLGWGPGVFRIQPFVAQADGPVQGGIAFNMQQQLGENSPFGWFGRFGVGGSDVASGASTQIGTGFIVRGPLPRFTMRTNTSWKPFTRCNSPR